MFALPDWLAYCLLLLLLQALTEFFGSLSADWALECLKELLLTNMQVRGGLLGGLHSRAAADATAVQLSQGAAS